MVCSTSRFIIDMLIDDILHRYVRTCMTVNCLRTYSNASNYSRGFNSGAALINLFRLMCGLNSGEASIRGRLQFEEIRYLYNNIKVVFYISIQYTFRQKMQISTDTM